MVIFVSVYADDTKIFSNNRTDLQINLNKLSSWLELYQLHLAPNKCKHMAINQKCNKAANQYFFNLITISNVNMVRDLGIFVSCDLTWRNHISYIFQELLCVFIVYCTALAVEMFGYCCELISHICKTCS